MQCQSKITPLSTQYSVRPQALFANVMHAREMVVRFVHDGVDHYFCGYAPEVIDGLGLIGEAALLKADQPGTFLLRDAGWSFSWRASQDVVAIEYWDEQARAQRRFTTTHRDLAILLESSIDEYVSALKAEVENCFEIPAVSDRISYTRGIIRELRGA